MKLDEIRKRAFDIKPTSGVYFITRIFEKDHFQPIMLICEYPSMMFHTISYEASADYQAMNGKKTTHEMLQTEVAIPISVDSIDDNIEEMDWAIAGGYN